MACNKPRRTPSHPKKSHVVKACEGGKEKVIRYGEQGASTAGKPKKGESAKMKAKRKSFKARHGKNIARGKMSAAFWANKSKWQRDKIMAFMDYFKRADERLVKGRKKREAEQEMKKNAPAKKKAEMMRQIEARNAKETARQGKAMAKTAGSRPTPKRPSATSLQNAATPKPTRPMKPEVPPTSRVKPPMDKVTGKGGRNVGTGKDKKANVTKEQLDASGMSLRNYLNFMDKNGKRPPKAGKMMGGGMAMKYKDGGKLPMVEKNGKMVPAYAADGKGKMMGGGMAKAYMGGGMAKKYKDGGGVRGAGCAQRGVRKAKIL